MIYHITYTDRYTGRTETGRVGVDESSRKSATQLRREAINAAYFKYATAKRESIRAVATYNSPMKVHVGVKRGKPTLDIIEGNSEESF